MKTTFEWWLQTTDHDDGAGDASEGPFYVGLVTDVDPNCLVGKGTDIPADHDGSMAEQAAYIATTAQGLAHYVMVLEEDGSVEWSRYTDLREARAEFDAICADLTEDEEAI